MRRLLILCCALTMILAGCQGNTTPTSNTTTPAPDSGAQATSETVTETTLEGTKAPEATTVAAGESPTNDDSFAIMMEKAVRTDGAYADVLGKELKVVFDQDSIHFMKSLATYDGTAHMGALYLLVEECFVNSDNEFADARSLYEEMKMLRADPEVDQKLMELMSTLFGTHAKSKGIDGQFK